MTTTEKEIRDQLVQALVSRAEADERIVQLRAMLQAVQAYKGELMKAEEEAAQQELFEPEAEDNADNE